MQNAEPLENLADQFARFPGIGRKGAVRMAYEVMSMSNEQAMELAKAIEHAKSDLHRCRIRLAFNAASYGYLRHLPAVHVPCRQFIGLFQKSHLVVSGRRGVLLLLQPVGQFRHLPLQVLFFLVHHWRFVKRA